MYNKVMSTNKYKVKEYTNKQALLRSIRVFTILIIIGLSIIFLLYKLNDKPVIAKDNKIDIKPYLISSPDRPKDYPESLPTLNNISLVGNELTIDGIYYTLVTNSTPQEAVNMVTNAFLNEGWDNYVVNAETSLLGSFTKDSIKVGVEVTSKKREPYINGWVTITLLLEDKNTIKINPNTVNEGIVEKIKPID
jgi:hypothetical protein